MPKLKIAAANLAWMTSCLPAYRSFQNALLNPQRIQKEVLMTILRSNRLSGKGLSFKFSTINTVREYQARVPISTHDDIAPLIDEIKIGVSNPLTTERVEAFEKTSGSSSAAKYIPYTHSLRRQFQNAVRAWISDLYRHDAKLLTGRSYWLITPLNREVEVTPSGIRVGFESDSEYLGRFERSIAETLFAVPSSLSKVNDIEASLYLTLRFLIQSEDLTMISIWNPSYLAVVLARLDLWADQLIDDLRRGVTSHSRSEDIPSSLRAKLRTRPERARELQQILKCEGRLSTKVLWPNLRLISCWVDGSARQGLQDLSDSFPGIRIQGKGLLATEGVATIPWSAANGCLPALTSHFLEFLPEKTGETRLVHELEIGLEYSVIMTTAGGLYRYRLGDRVRVEGFHNGVPILKLIGRDDGVSDLRGEKLSPAFVQACLDAASAASGIAVRFTMLAPHFQSTPGYVLFVESHDNPAALGRSLESALKENPHYEYCRKLGQLQELRVYWVEGSAHEIYLNRCVGMGQRAGGVKATSIHRADGWEEFFEGRFVSTHQETGKC